MKRSSVIILIGSFLLLQSCLDWFLERPDFTLKEVAVTRISPTHINFLFGIEVQNPNSFDLKLRALEYTVYFNDREVGKGRLGEEVLIAQSSSTVVQVPLQADFKSLGDPLAMIIAGHNLRYKIAGAAVFKASLASATIPFSQSGEISLKR
jgi:LEA14-like dessication related protein